MEVYLNDKNRRAFKVINTTTNTNEVIGHAEIYLYEANTARLCRILIGNNNLRGKGLGTDIIECLVDFASHKLDVETIDLNVYDWNTAAIKCYEKVGFVTNPEKSTNAEVKGVVWTAINMVLRKHTWFKNTDTFLPKMKNYTHNHHVHNNVVYTIMNEEKSLRNFKLKLERLLTKEEIKKYGTDTENLSKYCHSKNVYYPITVFKQETPICFMENRTKTFAVRFLDERLFWYVVTNYTKFPDGKMFLDEIWIREYMYKEDEELRDLKSDQHFQFTTKGDLKITTETIIRDGETQILREVKEASKPVNVSQNWQKTPEFGDYYYLVDYKEIIKPGDFLKETER